ncbi:MAG: DUF4404 family protein [Pirellulales bacterium]|nr:DUF4404 family protein [Pirellulales bacterium]
MEKKEILQTLEALHQELQSAESIDEQTQALLAKLTDDIRRLTQPNDENTVEDAGKLSAQVHDLMLKFESDHPQLTRALNQVSSALASLGI